MKRIIRISAIMVVTCLLYLNSYAWNARGHMIAATIAYEKLDQKVKERLDAIISTYEDLPEWRSQAIATTDSLLHHLYQTSIWPDKIRRSGHPHDHPSWHFVTYEIYPDGRKMTERLEPENDVIYGINYSIDILKDPTLADSLKALYLSWLIHLVADIHQPMHCATLFSSDFPEGDRGGNRFMVDVDGEIVKLHSVWDRLPGSGLEQSDIISESLRLSRKFPAGKMKGVSDLDPLNWSLESNDLAFKYAYQKGKLAKKYSLDKSPVLNRSYFKKAEKITQKRLSLAGYRLAELLNMILK